MSSVLRLPENVALIKTGVLLGVQRPAVVVVYYIYLVAGSRNVAECAAFDVHDVVDVRIVLNGDGTLTAEVAIERAVLNVVGSTRCRLVDVDDLSLLSLCHFVTFRALRRKQGVSRDFALKRHPGCLTTARASPPISLQEYQEKKESQHSFASFHHRTAAYYC